jgi:hypothetical protein
VEELAKEDDEREDDEKRKNEHRGGEELLLFERIDQLKHERNLLLKREKSQVVYGVPHRQEQKALPAR